MVPGGREVAKNLNSDDFSPYLQNKEAKKARINTFIAERKKIEVRSLVFFLVGVFFFNCQNLFLETFGDVLTCCLPPFFQEIRPPAFRASCFGFGGWYLTIAR